MLTLNDQHLLSVTDLRLIILLALVSGSVPVWASSVVAQTDDEMVVQARSTPYSSYAAGQLIADSHISLLGNRNFMDTAFNTASYSEKFITNHQAQDIGAVIGAIDPSVYIPGKRALQETFFIRGFPVNMSANSAVTFNGLIGMAPYFRGSTEMAERIEVLKGPSTLFNGMPPDGSVGGNINIVPKRAQDKPVARLTATYESAGLAGIHTDLGHRFGANNQFGIRFNGVYRDGNTAVDDQRDKMALASFGMDWRSKRARFSVDIYKQQEHLRGIDFVGIISVNPAVTLLPAPKTGDHSLAAKWAYTINNSAVVVLRGDVNITSTINAYAAWGYGKYDFTTQTADKILLNNAGDLAYSTSSALTYSNEKVSSAEAGLKGLFNTGSVDHDWSIALNRFDLTGSHIRGRSNNPIITNIYHIDFATTPRITDAPPAFSTESTLTSYAIADTLSFAQDRIKWMAGVRYQNVKSSGYNKIKSSGYNKSRFSPATGLLIRLTDEISVYGNYIEGLSKGGMAPSYAVNSGETLKPYQTRQYEAGTKLDSGNFTSTFSLFQIKQPTAYVDPLTNRYGVYGEQRNRGVEWNFFAEPVYGLRFIGGVSYTQAELTEALKAASKGKQLTGIPEFMAKLGVEYDVAGLSGLTLTGNVSYVSQRYVSDDHRLSLPSYTIIDLGTRYVTKIGTTPIIVQGIVKNITNKAYWNGSLRGGDGSGLSGGLGAPRTFMLSTAVEF